MRKLLVALCLCVCSVMAHAQQIAKGLTASNGVFIGFYEYKPTNYNTNTKYPLIIFLHGIGERGNGTTDLPNILNNGTPNNIKNGSTMTFTWNGKTETFLVLTPQLSPNYGSWPTFYVDEMLNYAKKNLSVDTNRVFLTGLSLGGGGVWYSAGSSLASAKRFAAIGVSCGTCQGIDWCNFAKANLPVWAFHASNDGTVGVGCTTSAIANINNCNPAVKPYMTIWPDGDHWIWGRVYDEGYTWQNPNIYEWFLGQNRTLPVNVRPVAVAGVSQNTTTGNGTATLNASASYDKDGKVVRYVWRKIDGPGYGTIQNAVSTDGKAYVSQLWAAGTYRYEVKVIDDRAEWTLDTTSVVVTTGAATNQPPVANAGSDISITLPTNNTTLNGTASKDPDGTISAYAWSYVSGPSQYSIAAPSGATTSLTNLVQGTYTFKLTVTDNAGASASANVNVVVNPAPNQPPVANAGNNATITLPISSVTLDGSASKDPDGTITSYAWTWVSGPTQYTIANASAVSTTVSNLAQGTYTFKLAVTDNSGTSSSATVQVVVNAAPSNGDNSTGGTAPIIKVDAGPDIIVTLPANSTTLNGSASDSRGPIQQYKWVKIDGPAQYTITSPSSAVTTITNLIAGTYSFRFDVWDNAWNVKSDTVIVTVKASTVTSPLITVDAGPDITLTLPANSTTLNGSAYDSRGPIQLFKWVKVSGPDQYTFGSPGSPVTTLSNLAAGTYMFRLDIWDYAWYPRGDTVIVTVKGGTTPSTPVITVDAGPDITLTLPTNSTTLNGSAYDSRGPIQQFKWVKVSGPDQYTFGSPSSPVTTLSNLVAGTYMLRLDIWDNAWYPRGDTVIVTVKGGTTPSTPVITVDAGPDITLTLPTNSTTLNGSAYDSRGPIQLFKWVKVSGPDQYTFGSPNAPVTTLSNLVAGTYMLRLDIWDNAWYPRGDTVIVTVKNNTSSPVITVDAGPDINLKLPTNSTTLNGSAYDSRGPIQLFKWVKVSGPDQYTFGSPNAPVTTLSNLVAGTYMLRLDIWDYAWYPRGDTVIVTVSSTGNAVANRIASTDVAADNSNTETKLSVYPNPVTDAFNLQYTSNINGKGVINIYDIHGKLLRRVAIEKTSTLFRQNVNVSNLPTGAYYVELIIENQKRTTAKFIKQQQ